MYIYADITRPLERRSLRESETSYFLKELFYITNVLSD